MARAIARLYPRGRLRLRDIPGGDRRAWTRCPGVLGVPRRQLVDVAGDEAAASAATAGEALRRLADLREVGVLHAYSLERSLYDRCRTLSMYDVRRTIDHEPDDHEDARPDPSSRAR